jgi:hypothetical protein
MESCYEENLIKVNIQETYEVEIIINSKKRKKIGLFLDTNRQELIFSNEGKQIIKFSDILGISEDEKQEDTFDSSNTQSDRVRVILNYYPLLKIINGCLSRVFCCKSKEYLERQFKVV